LPVDGNRAGGGRSGDRHTDKETRWANA
jgi:hypothetical protein